MGRWRIIYSVFGLTTQGATIKTEHSMYRKRTITKLSTLVSLTSARFHPCSALFLGTLFVVIRSENPGLREGKKLKAQEQKDVNKRKPSQ